MRSAGYSGRALRAASSSARAPERTRPRHHEGPSRGGRAHRGRARAHLEVAIAASKSDLVFRSREGRLLSRLGRKQFCDVARSAPWALRPGPPRLVYPRAPMEEVERRYIARVMEAVGGNNTLAAKVLGFDRKTLFNKLERKQRS